MAFFRKKKIDNHVESQEEIKNQEDDFVKTSLHFPEDWDVAPKEKYVFQYHHNKMAKLKNNQISIAAIKFLELDGEIVVEALIQNALPQPLKFQDVDLIIVDEENNPVAKKKFSLDHLGELPPATSTPFRFLFLNEDRLSNVSPADNWKILFQLKSPSTDETLDLEPGWEERLTPEKKAQLEGVLETLPKLGPEEVNIVGIDLKFHDNQSLEVIVLVRNGTSQHINLEQLPLSVEDTAGDLVCHGLFKLPPLQIKSNTAKPWAFVFPEDLILKKQPDFHNWRVFVKEGKQEEM
ncbi:MAG: accessory Sec system S-layer assembly protein [Bacillota bacterium]|nr:accessory Sec system S-layer assembly protein [Bacillota bacterium]